MKCIPILIAAIMPALITGLAYGKDKMIVSASDIDIQFVDKNCWVDLFEKSEFDVAETHVRVMGPFQSPTLGGMAGQNWNNEVQSLIVGPNATVFAYKNPDFSGPEVVFASNQRVGELDELDMSNDFESLKIQCGKE